MNLSIYSNNQTPMFRSSYTKVPVRRLFNRKPPISVRTSETGVFPRIQALANLVRRKSTLATNSSVQANMQGILVKSEYGSFDFRGMSLNPYLNEVAGARLRLLNAYSNNKSIRKNPLISGQIGFLAGAIKKYSQAKCAVKMLENGAKIQDAKYFDSLGNMLRYNIQPQLIEKVLGNENLYKNIKSETLYNIRGNSENKTLIGNIDEILDMYLKKLTGSDNVTVSIDKILSESFSQIKEPPVEYASKMF